MNKRSVGTKYEQEAADYLINVGFEILEMNFRCKLGEIDIIAKKNDYIHFIEVKYRKSSRYGYPVEAVDYRKRRKICKTAMYYICKNGLSDNQCASFDVLSILDKNILLYENAHEFIE